MELDTDSTAIGAGVFTVIEAPDVVHAQDGEDVVNTYAGLHIWPR